MPRTIPIFFFSLALVGAASADTYLVKPDGTGDFASISAAISGTVDGDIIELADGTFTGDDNRNIWIYDKSITIRSQNGIAENCIIDPDGGEGLVRRAFIFQGTTAGFVIEDITFTDGSALGGGGSNYGGAMLLNDNSSPTITGCVFIDNQAGRGGAIFTFNNCSPAITNCVFTDNFATDYGGAIQLNSGSNPAITDCLFFENSSGSSGGAFSVWNGGAPTITNCTLSGNSAPEGGSGAWCRWGGAPSFVKTIIAFASAGNAVSCESGDGNPSFSCCDIFGNAGGDWVDCIAGLDGSNNNISADPLFCNLEAGNFYLCSNSPCLPSINACGELVGRYGSNCGDCQTAASTESWGRMRILYR